MRPIIGKQTVEWFFGRGLSIGCGLNWAVPDEWRTLPREEQIAKIKNELTTAMSESQVDTDSIKQFLSILSSNTAPGWAHRFHTTNWDFLLQREIQQLGLKELPSWLAGSHVYHLNGTVEVLSDNSQRSEFVLESDPSSARSASIEGDIAYNKFIWSRTFVVVGMSFECEVDKYLLGALNRIEDDLPIGESVWVVLNPDKCALSATCDRLKNALPQGKIIDNASMFDDWLKAGMPELRCLGAVVF